MTTPDSVEVTDPSNIESVAVEPDHCHRCGAEVGTCQWEGDEHPWCPDCEMVLSRHPVPAVHVVVHDEERVLLLDEPIPQHEGLWSLPGGYTKYDEPPEQSVVRELEEETGLRADHADLEFLTILHVEVPGTAFYFITYSLARADAVGEIAPEFDDGDVDFVPVEEIRSSPDRLRDTDRERIEMALDG